MVIPILQNQYIPSFPPYGYVNYQVCFILPPYSIVEVVFLQVLIFCALQILKYSFSDNSQTLVMGGGMMQKGILKKFWPS